MILSGHGSWEKSNEPRFLSLNLGGTSPGRLLIDGLGELMDRFKQSGDCIAFLGLHLRPCGFANGNLSRPMRG
jgi:hypothetical protein